MAEGASGCSRAEGPASPSPPLFYTWAVSGKTPCLYLFLFGAITIHAQRSSSIITLVMPPPGSEGISALGFGGGSADGATSAYFNPALLSDLERNTGSQLHFTTSNQALLPVLRISDLHQYFQGFAAVLPDHAGGTDLGVGWYRNRVEFGRNENPLNGTSIQSNETVTALALGIRLGFPASLGVCAKFFESRLAPDDPESPGLEGTAHGFAFDAGLLLNPRLEPPRDWVVPYLELSPNLHLSIRNLGPDAFYQDPDQADPIPTTFAAGAGMEARLVDFIMVGAAWSQESEVHHWTSEPLVDYRGFSVGFLGYRFSRGWLDDDRGRRWERHTAKALEADMLRVYRFLCRLGRFDFRSPSRSLDGGFPFAIVRVLGQDFRANPRISVGRRRIDSRDNGIRQDQKSWFLAMSL